MKILRTRVSHEIYYYLYYDLTMICHNKKNSKKEKKTRNFGTRFFFSIIPLYRLFSTYSLSFDITSRDPSQV